MILSHVFHKLARSIRSMKIFAKLHFNILQLFLKTHAQDVYTYQGACTQGDKFLLTNSNQDFLFEVGPVFTDNMEAQYDEGSIYSTNKQTQLGLHTCAMCRVV